MANVLPVTEQIKAAPRHARHCQSPQRAWHCDGSRRRLDASASHRCAAPGDLIESGVFWDISG